MDSPPSRPPSTASASSSSPHQVLPPIITNEADRVFLKDLNNFIDVEILKIDQDYPEQRYIVHKAAFDRIIDHVTAYKPLLTAVKAEYEDTIDTIRRGQKEANFLSNKLRAMASEPSTRRNYQKRADELEERLTVVKDDNTRLAQQVQLLRQARLEKEQLEKRVYEIQPKKQVVKEWRVIPGLSVEQATDKALLTSELGRLEKQVRDLNISKKTKYVPKDNKGALRDQLTAKVTTRDRLQRESEYLKMTRQKLKIAVEAVRVHHKLQPTHETVGQAVMLALARPQGSQQDKGDVPVLLQEPSTMTFEEDDPMREKEADMILDYIEKFNELFEDGKYEEAAIHAANSPKGVLRTMETMNRFKALPRVGSSDGSRGALLAYCDALMSSVLAVGARPSEALSLECVKAALDENRLDLLTHWVSQNRLSITEELGDRINQYCKDKSRIHLTLAENIFIKVGAHRQAVLAIMQQGRVHAGLEYAQNVGHLPTDEYLRILECCPSLPLAQALVAPTEIELRADSTSTGQGTLSYPGGGSTTPGGRTPSDQLLPSEVTSLLPLGVTIRCLLYKGMQEEAFTLLQDIFDNKRQSESDREVSCPSLRQLVFSDKMTSPEDWSSIVVQCRDAGYKDVGIELLAATTVLNVVSRAVSSTPDSSR